MGVEDGGATDGALQLRYRKFTAALNNGLEHQQKPTREIQTDQKEGYSVDKTRRHEDTQT